MGAIDLFGEEIPESTSEGEGTSEGTPIAQTLTPPVSSEPPLHLQFTEVRNELLSMERAKGEGKDVNIDRVQELVRKAADLMARIQTSTTGPKKKVIDGTIVEKKTKKAASPKKPSSIAHLNIPEGDDF
jgi:hypothetical protein